MPDIPPFIPAGEFEIAATGTPGQLFVSYFDSIYHDITEDEPINDEHMRSINALEEFTRQRIKHTYKACDGLVLYEHTNLREILQEALAVIEASAPLETTFSRTSAVKRRIKGVLKLQTIMDKDED